ncbi:MAG TPA: M23 family metallopeptidase [Oligoflexus sp.]|uniref:M23 family metallopeptidase n=1 Tax=Oligoflexus sp. TaxID=1971216 RepID=UPI002D4E6D99|nr:M23 family metallopeptidase [Oligoflexus sp.]HYX33297.1 M23 family metallopeptidase [Oligoflexus sp.]
MPQKIYNLLFLLILLSCGDSSRESDAEETADSYFCPTPFLFNPGSKLCESDTEALGPFPGAMTSKCIELGGGESCQTARWTLSIARTARGNSGCPPGTTLHNNLCKEGPHAYGPFTPMHVSACRARGGGLTCDSMRWDFDFALQTRPPDAFTFPFGGPALASYTEPPRSFGSCRDNCTRRHAAADLYATTGTLVHAVGDGEIIDFYEFYLGTYALVIDHGDFIVRYGEVTQNLAPGIRVGVRVQRGQGIAYVGRLIGLDQDMLHFERFAGWAQGPLTVYDDSPYQRRQDLVDPTADLIAWKYPR